MRFVRLFWFHFKEYLSDQYFVTLTLTSTLSIFLVQYTLAYANHQLTNTSVWLQSAIFGMWSSCTTAAGSIGFERYKGTLPYLINNAYDERLSLIALLLPASTYGLAAFPLAWLLAQLLGVTTDAITFKFSLTVILLWLAMATMGIFIASFFTLTPNAITYESLIGIPLVLLSGLFGNPNFLRPFIKIAQWFIPMTTPIATLTGTSLTFNWSAYFSSLIIWFFLIILMVKKINQLARKKGELNLI
ncbi:multidrug ABC transporter permease [Lactobacillus sp. ESL0233]|uniref:ABC transporter permease n=1 Tax=Lactobacillus sp. ESL0233 TaxID=2069354 RepID=UPI000EFB0538|nr:ABC transporter permease [Lactobacillus sp. ESL0233]RMC42237.1 multidrug ABC transporter permease [Lactobacillus sp. ESL0233]